MEEAIREANVADALPPDLEARFEFLQSPCTEVPQDIPLDVGPHQLNRIEFRSVRREIPQREPCFTYREGRHGLRLVDACVVQNHHDLSWDVRQHVLQKANHIRALERAMLRVLQELAGSGDRADGRDLVPAGFAEHHGRLAAQRPSVFHRSFQAEPHLIQKDQRRSCSYFFLISGRVV